MHKKLLLENYIMTDLSSHNLMIIERNFAAKYPPVPMVILVDLCPLHAPFVLQYMLFSAP